MRLSIARTSAGGHNPAEAANRAEAGFDVRSAAWRRMALALSAVLILGCIGIVFGSSKPAGATTQFTSGQVFASVGNSAVNVYSQGSGNPLLESLNDGQDEPYTAGSAFDSSGNFYVTDDYSGDVSEYAPDGTLDGVFASGLQNPLSLAFDNQGNLYVGQQATPYIAELIPRPASSCRTSDRCRLNSAVTTGLRSHQTSAPSTTRPKAPTYLRYNKCTNRSCRTSTCSHSRRATRRRASLYRPSNSRSCPNGDVLVADSNADILLDPNGNVLQTYSCASLPGCQRLAVRHKPSTRTATPSGPGIRPPATSEGRHRLRRRAADRSTRTPVPCSDSRSTTRSRWLRRRRRRLRCPRRSRSNP